MSKTHAIALMIIALAGPTFAWGQQQGGINFQELFGTLDANGDRVIERDEVPESGRAAFDRLVRLGDGNKDGKIQQDEYRELLLRARDSSNSAPGGQALTFDAMDKNSDGKLTREEFKGLAPFDRIDADKDGFLSRDELTKFRAEMAASGGNSPLAARLKAMDKNGDGKLSRDEFTGPPPRFDILDKNKDGFIDSAEMLAAAQAGAAAKKKAAAALEKPAEKKEEK